MGGTSAPWVVAGAGAAVVCVAGRFAYQRLVAGDLTLDLGIGRRVRPLGPIDVAVGAPRDLVYEVIAAPYLGRGSKASEGKIEVLERSDAMVLAAHRTPVDGSVTTTVETVRFEPPEVVHFRLLRGPVPHVVERFVLSEDGDGTDLHYEGELGTDLWAIGRRWGDLVATRWEATVRSSLAEVRRISEERFGAQRRREGST